MASTLNVPFQSVSRDEVSSKSGLAVKLTPFLEWVGTLPKRDPLFRADCEKYITALVAGDVGVFLLGESLRTPETAVKAMLARAGKHCRRACDKDYPEWDLAFALAVSWFARVDGGDPNTTIRRLWRTAFDRLNESDLKACVSELATELLAGKVVSSGKVRFMLAFKRG